MLEQSYLRSQIFSEGMDEQGRLKPNSGKGRRSLLFTLTLTSLIDAFVIIVIYLLVNFGNPQSLKLEGNIQLPQAVQNEQIDEGTVVSINQGRYFIDNKEVSLVDVTRQLYENIQNKPSNKNLVIQADKKTDYSSLSPIILAGSQAGYHQFKFAVLQAGNTR